MRIARLRTSRVRQLLTALNAFWRLVCEGRKYTPFFGDEFLGGCTGYMVPRHGKPHMSDNIMPDEDRYRPLNAEFVSPVVLATAMTWQGSGPMLIAVA